MNADYGVLTIATLGAVSGAAWFAVFWRKTSWLGLSLLTLLVAICFGYYFWNSGGKVPLSADRVLWGLLLVALAISALKEHSLGMTRRADLFLLGFVGYLGLNALITFWQEGQAGGVSRWLFFYAFPATLYLAVRRAEITQTAQEMLLFIFAGLGGYLSVIGLGEVAGWTWLVFPPYIMQTDITGEFFGRARGPLLNPVVNGFLMVLGWVAWCLLRDRFGGWWRLLWLAGHALLAGGVFATLTRSVWLSAAAALMLVLTGLVDRRYRRAWLVTAVVLVVATGLIVRIFFWEMKRDRHLSPAEAARSVQLRPLLAHVAWQMIQDRPVLGFGLGQYDRAKRMYVADPLQSQPVRQVRHYTQHNVFLSLAVETGLVGLGGFLFLLGSWGSTLRALCRHSPSPLGLLGVAALVGYVINGLFHDVSIIPQMNAVLFFVAGLVESVGQQAADRDAISPNCAPNVNSHLPSWEKSR